MKRQIFLLLILSFVFSTTIIAQTKKSQKNIQSAVTRKDTNTVAAFPIVTFIELGSVNCIPCKAMQPVMKNVEEKYGNQLKVVFYDVWKQEQAHYAQEYKIRLIPTQIFLDSNGKELMRHEGSSQRKRLMHFYNRKVLSLNP